MHNEGRVVVMYLINKQGGGVVLRANAFVRVPSSITQKSSSLKRKRQP